MGQFPATTVSFNLAPGASLGAAVTAIENVQKKLPEPAGNARYFSGHGSGVRRSLTNEAILMLSALITVYIVLGVLYESYIHPVTILSTLPSASVGALLALLICGDELTVVAIIGIVLLIGIVQKNAIMMIDFALEARAQGTQKRARGDSRGLPAALSSDSHDHDGGDAGRRRRSPSARAWVRSSAVRSASPSSAA